MLSVDSRRGSDAARESSGAPQGDSSMATQQFDELLPTYFTLLQGRDVKESWRNRALPCRNTEILIESILYLSRGSYSKAQKANRTMLEMFLINYMRYRRVEGKGVSSQVSPPGRNVYPRSIAIRSASTNRSVSSAVL